MSQPPPPNCPPSYSAGYTIIGDSVSFCLDGVNLSIIPSSTLNSTDSYSVNSIPYNPYPWVGANAILVGIDDIWSGVVPLPFPFCFFGQKYNSVVIGANGQVGFDVSQAGMFNAWASNGWVAPNNNAAMNNTIMAPYQDVNPGVIYAGSNITWDIYGQAPCRYMVISWDSIPMFSCSSMLNSAQVVLFESTYLIDINIKEKPLCSTWNGGVAHEGIQNATGTVAFMVPGRNGTTWQATNDSYRFTPSGTQTVNFNYTWIDVNTGAVLGTGPTLSYFPTTNTQVTVQMTAITDCDTIQAALNDTINIIVTGNVTADFNYEVHLGCDEDTVIFTNTSTSSVGGVPLYQWDFGDLSGSTATSPTHIYADQNTYSVRLIASDNGCIDTMIKVIDLNHPINAAFAVGPNDSICLGDNMVASSVSTPLLFLTHDWTWGDGATTTGNPSGHIYATPGVYTINLTVTDTLGCVDTSSMQVFVDNPPFVDFITSDDNVCIGDPVFFSDTMAPFTQSFTWDFGDGSTLNNIHNPSHSWANPNTAGYTVSLTGYYLICPPMTVTKNIIVNDYPSVNLGDDTTICPGITGAITLADLNNPSATFLWNTGETSNSITVTQPGHYWVMASNGDCTTTDSIWIMRDCYLNIPNSFSPNGDGLNDYFLPRELLSSGLKTFKMNLFNRWGELVFTTDKIDGRGWDGKLNGVNQPMGVFVYVIEAEFINNVRKNYTGNVTLIR
ncbi:MAG: gliding motility-associated C-terminal domain-containing protein [Chitinophagaceae bacterium]|nr:gliding motility-associated C-terminal domain-containing protein [Chitinophagaceae bacterium]